MPSTSRSAGTRGRPWRAGSRLGRGLTADPAMPAPLAADRPGLPRRAAGPAGPGPGPGDSPSAGVHHPLPARPAPCAAGRRPRPRSWVHVVKTDRDRSGRQAVSAARGLHPMLATVCPETHVVEPLGYSAMEWAALWRLTGGTPLSEQLVGRSPDAAAYVSLVGHAARAPARPCPVRPGPGVRGAPARARRGRRDRIHTSGRRPPGASPGRGPTVRRAGHRGVAVRGLDAEGHADVPPWRPEVRQPARRGRPCAHPRSRPGVPGRSGPRPRQVPRRPAVVVGRRPARRPAHRGPSAPATARCRPPLGQAELLAALFEAKFAARRCAVHDPAWEHQVQDQATRLGQPRDQRSA